MELTFCEAMIEDLFYLLDGIEGNPNHAMDEGNLQDYAVLKHRWTEFIVYKELLAEEEGD